MIRQIARQFARRHVAECELMLEGMAVLIPMEDEPVHTDDYPFCRDPSCPCHSEKTGYQQGLIGIPYFEGLLTAVEAARLYWMENI